MDGVCDVAEEAVSMEMDDCSDTAVDVEDVREGGARERMGGWMGGGGGVGFDVPAGRERLASDGGSFLLGRCGSLGGSEDGRERDM